MRLQEIGRVADPRSLNLEPIVVPVVAYTRDYQAREIELEFHPMAPTQAALEMIGSTDEKGDVTISVAFSYLQRCMLPESLERWQKFLADPDLEVPPQTVVGVYQGVCEVYAGRPTERQSDSPAGVTTAAPTSTDEQPAMASVSMSST